MVALYIISLIFLVAVVAGFLRHSEFGILVLVVEFPFIAGLCLYPVLFELGAVIPGYEAAYYISTSRIPGPMTAFHILCYSVFSALGYLFAKNYAFTRPSAVARGLESLGNPKYIWRILILFGLLTYSLFLFLVGPEIALVNAIRARSGDFEGFGDSDKYLFLKTLASLSTYSACFIPFVFPKTRPRFFLAAYLILILIAYLNSISRNLILYQFVVPTLIVIYAQGVTKKNLIYLTFLVLPIVSLVLFFGKPFGYFISAAISGGDILDVEAYQGEDGLWNSLMRNYESYWFSVDAGLTAFSIGGLTLPIDSFMAFLGFIPSRILEGIGMGWLAYVNSDFKLSCFNTEQFGIDACSVPPWITGVSAYIAPLVGGAVAGFMKYFVFGRLEKVWIYYKKSNYALTWIPYFIFLVSAAYFTFVPSNIALATFAIGSVITFLTIRRLLRLIFKARYAAPQRLSSAEP